jgi:hypothetical protein
MTDPDPAARFAVVPLGRDDQAPENAIAHGSWNALGPLLFDTRPLTAALDLAARTVAIAEQEHARQADEQQIIADGVTALVDGLAQLRQRLDTLERSQVDRRKLDAASEVARELLEIPQDKPPADVAERLTVRDQTPPPSGELHALPPSHPVDKEQLAAAASGDDQGALPAELRVGALPDPGTDPEFDPAKVGKAPAEVCWPGFLR